MILTIILFVWILNYSTKFGVFHVDHQNPNRTRTPKKSFKVIQKIFNDNGLYPSASIRSTRKKSISVVAVLAYQQDNKFQGVGTILLYSAPFAAVLSTYYAYTHVIVGAQVQT